jgi:hypothetical protein
MVLIRVIVRGLLPWLLEVWNSRIIALVLFVGGIAIICGAVAVGVNNLLKKRKSKLNDKGKT